MEPNDATYSQKLYRVLAALQAVLATLAAFLAVFTHWRAFDLASKLIAICLLSSLVTMPIIAIWREKTSKIELPRSQIIQIGYSWLLLAMILFSRGTK